jgi:hypothetical protein
MKKSLILLTIGILILVFSYSNAFSWGSGTHAFGAGHIGRALPLMNYNEIYGIMAPDLFNYSFELANNPPLDQYLRAHTHGFPGDESFLDAWKKAKYWGFQKNLAYGYVAHNDVWGMDFTAHWEARSISPPPDFPVGLPPAGLPPGYVIIKAFQLNQILKNIPEYAALNLPDELAIEVCHNLVETAGDILIAREDKSIGEKILLASLLRSPDFPNLLVRAIGQDYKDLILAAEKEFRKITTMLGGALLLGEEEAIQAFSEQMAELGAEFLKLYGYDLDPTLLRPLAEAGIREAIVLCESDYMNEIEATILFVKKNLWLNDIHY